MSVLGNRSLRIIDFSDRELLALVGDESGEGGWTSIDDVAQAIWPRSIAADPAEAIHAHRCVGARFRYLHKWGLLQKSVTPGLWALTSLGEQYVSARLSNAQRAALDGAREGQELLLASLMGELYERAADTGATLMRREFQFRQHRRRVGIR